MNDSKNARSNLTKSRWLRLSASIGLAFGLAVVMLMLPLFAGTTVTVPVPQLSSAPDTTGQANWSLTSSSVQLGLPFGVQSVAAVGGISVTKFTNVITAYQGGAPADIASTEYGEIVYTILLTNNTGLDINAPFYISDTIPAGTYCYKTDNDTSNGWLHNTSTCQADRVAQFSLLPPGSWPAGAARSFKVSVLPDGVSGGFAAHNGSYVVKNETLKLHNPGGLFGAGAPLTENLNVTVTVKAPVWEIIKVAPTVAISKGDWLTYTVSVRNNGQYPVKSDGVNLGTTTTITITEQLPPQGDFTTAKATDLTVSNVGNTTINTTTGKVTWVFTNVAFLNMLASMSNLTVTFKTNASLPSGFNIENTTYNVDGAENVYRPGVGPVITTVVQGTEPLTVTKKAYVPANDTTSTVCTNNLTVVNTGWWPGVTNGDASTCVPASGGGQNGSIIYTIRITAGGDIVNVKLTDYLGWAGNLKYVSHSLVSPISGTVNFNVDTSTTPNVIVMSIPATLHLGDVYVINIGAKTVDYVYPGTPELNGLEVSPVAAITTTNVFSNITLFNPAYIYEYSVISAINKIVVTKTVATNRDGNVPAGSTGFARPGEALTYTLSIRNDGPNGIAFGDLQDAPENHGATDSIYLRGDLGVLFDGIRPATTFEDLANGAGSYTANPEDGLIIRSLELTAGTPQIEREFVFYATAPLTPAFNPYINDVWFNGTPDAGSFTAPIIVPNTSISLTKVVSGVSPTYGPYDPAVGWVLDGKTPVTYTYYLTNNSNIALDSLSLTDNVLGTISLTTLALGATGSGTETHTQVVTSYVPNSMHLVSGTNFITNWAYLTGSTTVNGVVVTASAVPTSAGLLISDTLSFTVTKYVVARTLAASNLTGLPTVGDIIQYAYTVTNQSSKFGRLTLVKDTLLDGGGTLVGGSSPVFVDIAPFASYPITRNFTTLAPLQVTLKESDILASVPSWVAAATGEMTFTNLVSVTGNLFTDASRNTAIPLVKSEFTNTVGYPVTYTARISVAKYAVLSSRTYTQLVDAWDKDVVPTDTLDYYLFITNTGNVSVTFPVGSITDVIETANPPIALANTTAVTLAPGASLNRDIFGAVTVTTYLSNSPISMTHFIANIVTPTAVNGAVTTGTLTNTFGVGVVVSPDSLPLTTLATFVDTDQGLAIPSMISDNIVSLPLSYTAKLTVTKWGSPITASLNGQVTYTLLITNAGNAPLKGVVVSDVIRNTADDVIATRYFTSGSGGYTGSIPEPFPANTAITISFTLDVTGAVIAAAGGNNKPITNTAIVTGWVIADGKAITDTNAHYTATATSNGAVVTTSVTGAFNVTKRVSAGETLTNAVKVGDVITYTYLVEMLNTTPITNIYIYDRHLNPAGTGSTLKLITSGLTLSPTTQTTYLFTETHLVDDRDLRNNLPHLYITNTVVATGMIQITEVDGVGIYANSTSITETRAYLTFTNKITMTKEVMNVDTKVSSGVTNTSPITANIGQTLWYTYTIYNAGGLSYHAYYVEDWTLPNGVVYSKSDSTATVNPTLAVLGPQTTPANKPLVLTSSFKVDANTKAFVQAQMDGLLENTATAWLSPTVLLQKGQLALDAGIKVATATMTQSVALSSPTSIDLAKMVDWAGKTLSPTVRANVGDVVTYTYLITNTGSVDFEPQFNPDQDPPFGGVGVTLVDDKLGQILVLPNTVGLDKGKLVAGKYITVVMTHTVNYTDLNPSLILTNSAKVTGYVSAAFGDEITNAGVKTATVPLTYSVNLAVQKTSNITLGRVLSLGEPVVYTLTLVNSSNIPVSVTLSDVYSNGAATQSANFPKPFMMAANSTVITSYHDAVLPAYLDSKLLTQTLRNVVVATANDGIGNLQQFVAGNQYTSTSTLDLTAIYDLNIEVAKSTSTPIVHFDAATKTVTYSYVLTNTGKTTQTVTSLVDKFNNDPSLMITVATDIVLGPGKSTTVVTNVGITDAYLDNTIAKGQAIVSNIATANLTSGSNNVPFNSNLDVTGIPVPVTVTVFYTPSLQVVKTSSVNEARIGDTITYTVLVANNGLVTLRDIIFEDRLLGVINKTSLNMSPGGVPAQFVVTKTISQKDFDTLEEGGVITNTANVTGSRGLQDYPFDSNNVTVTIRSGASLALTKIGSATSVQVPATVAYTYTVTNNGTVDLTGITLTDDKLTLNVTPFDLLKNDVKVVTASTLLSTANQTVTNLATAQALFGTTPVVATATWTVKTTAAPVTTTATCTVSLVAPSPVVSGTAAFMTATVTASPTGTSTFAWNFGDGGTGTVNPISHTYTTTGTKSVTVTVTHSNGATCNVATASVLVNATAVPAPNLVVTKKTERPQVLAVGTRITYTISVSNTGNAPANSVVITDVLPAEVTLVASPTTTAGTVTVNGSTIRVEVPNLAPQAAPVIVTIVVQVDNDGIGKGTIVNTAFVSSLEQTVANSGLVTDPADLNDATQVIKKPKVNVFLPIILKQPTTGTATPTATAVTPTATPVTPVPGQPNLQSTIKLPASVSANSPVVVEVEVKNVGGAAVTQGFWVEFYINPNDAAGLTTRGGRWDSDENLGTLADPSGKQGIAWFVNTSNFGSDGALTAGETITLVSLPEGDSALSGRIGFDADQTTWHGRFVSGTSTLVSYADSFAGSGKNVYIVTESNENDNANTATSFGPLGAGGVDLTRGPFHPAR